MNKEFTIAPLRQKDRKIWEALYRGYNADDPRFIESAHMNTLWRRFLNPHFPLFGWYAVSANGDPAALVQCAAQYVTQSLAPVWYLNDLYVTPQHRNKGLARTLIDHVGNEARKSGVKKVYWITLSGNARARLLYDKIAVETDWIRYELKDGTHGT